MTTTMYEQLACGPGLRDERHAGILADRLPKVRRGKAAHEQHPHPARLAPDDLVQLEPAELGHHDVGNNEMQRRALGAVGLDSLLTVDRSDGPVADLREELLGGQAHRS